MPTQLFMHVCGCWAGLAPSKSSTSAPKYRKCALEEGERELSEHAAHTTCPKPVGYAHQTTCSSQNHIFYPTIGEWAGRPKAPLPIEIASFGKIQIERGAFSLRTPPRPCCARALCAPQYIPQHRIIMMHITSRMIIQLSGTEIYLPDDHDEPIATPRTLG